MNSSGPTSQATCSAAPKCGILGPPQRGGQPRRTNAGGWSTQPRRSHVGHSLMLCIPSAVTAPDPCSMDHDTHNLRKKQVDTHHHAGLHCCVYPAPHIHAAPDPCSMDSSGPTSQATCSAAPQRGSLGPPQWGMLCNSYNMATRALADLSPEGAKRPRAINQSSARGAML